MSFMTARRLRALSADHHPLQTTSKDIKQRLERGAIQKSIIFFLRGINYEDWSTLPYSKV